MNVYQRKSFFSSEIVDSGQAYIFAFTIHIYGATHIHTGVHRVDSDTATDTVMNIKTPTITSSGGMAAPGEQYAFVVVIHVQMVSKFREGKTYYHRNV